jgi:hypothetical protein
MVTIPAPSLSEPSARLPSRVQEIMCHDHDAVMISGIAFKDMGIDRPIASTS